MNKINKYWTETAASREFGIPVTTLKNARGRGDIESATTANGLPLLYGPSIRKYKRNYRPAAVLTTFDVRDASSSLVFDGPITDPYDGTVMIGENSSFQVTHDWLLGEDGEIQFNGGGGTASVTGGAFTNQGSLVVNSGTALIDTADVTLPAMSLITVQTGAELSIAGSLVQQQGTIQLGGGTLSVAALTNDGEISGFGTISSTGRRP